MFSLSERFLSVPLFFDLNELKAMEHSVLLVRSAEYPLAEVLERALAKIEHRLQESQLEHLRRQTGGIHILESSRGSSLESVLQKLEQAVTDRETVKINYAKSSSSSPEERMIDPYGLLYRLGKWYIIAFCHKRQALRVFRVDRVSAMTAEGRYFEVPQDFSVQNYLSHIHEHQDKDNDAPVVTVRLHGREDVLDAICSQWFLQPYLIERPSVDAAAFRLHPDWMLKYMPYLLLSFGKGIKVVEPQKLRTAISKTARELAQFHEN